MSAQATIDIGSILSAISGAINAIVQALSSYLPVMAGLAAGVAVAYIVLRFGKRLITGLFNLFGTIL
jgi:hypothetical protein